MAFQTPPHAEDAERGILGSIMIDPESVTYAIESLEPADFYNPANSIIFESMKELFMEDTALDSLTISDHLRNTKKFEAVGGNMYL
jgi:replicative DNA helicase